MSMAKAVEVAIERILNSVQCVREDNPDPYALIDHMESRLELLGLLDQADAASAVGKVGKAVITKCRDELSWALYDLQEVMAPMEYDYADKGDISSFLREDYMSRPKSD
jgi:hypothetical protein